MTTLIIGFVGLVLVPAAALAFILDRLNNKPANLCLHDDQLKFTLSSDAK